MAIMVEGRGEGRAPAVRVVMIDFEVEGPIPDSHAVSIASG
jgi:hypothetical protein